MKKKHVFMAIAIFVVGFVYGAIFNFILRGENASILLSYLQGFFVGMLASVIYLMQFLFCGYCFDREYINDSLNKSLIILENIIASIGVLNGITMFISSYNEFPITLNYAWMHIVNLLFAIAVVAKAYYDGKVLGKNGKSKF